MNSLTWPPGTVAGTNNRVAPAENAKEGHRE